MSWGAGLRASQFLVLGAKVRALLQGRSHVTVEDLQALAHPTLRHRILLNYRAEAEGIGVIPYSPLAGGFLTGKYRRNIKPDSARAKGLEKYSTEKNYQLIDLLEKLGEDHQASVAQMALAWVLRLPAMTSALIGTSRISQVEDSVAAIKNLAFSEAELKTIEAILK